MADDIDTTDDTQDQDQPNALASLVSKAQAGQEVDPDTAKAAMDQMHQTSMDDSYQSNASPESKQSLADAIAKAHELYNNKVNTNEWLDVAQMLGRAGAQYAAGREGVRNGRDMALQMQPPTDFEKRNERAEQEYGNTIKGLDTQAERESREKMEANREAGFNARTEAQERNATTRAQAAEKGANIRAGAAENAAGMRADTEDRKQQNRDLARQQADENAQYRDQVAGIPLITSELSGDASPKEIAAFKNKHPRELGSLSPQDIADAKEAATTPGTLWGTNFDEDKFQQNISSKIKAAHQDKISNLQSAIDSLYGKKQSAAPSAQAPQASSTSGGKTLSPDDLNKYAATHKIDPAAAQKFLESQGYTIQK